MGRHLVLVMCAAFFATGMIGKGLLTSIPGTAFLLLGLGWVVVRQPRAHRAEQTALTLTPSEGSLERVAARQYV